MILLNLILFTTFSFASNMQLNNKEFFHQFTKHEKDQYDDDIIQFLYSNNILDFNSSFKSEENLDPITGIRHYKLFQMHQGK